jgi:hypothetical protein
MSHRSGQRTPGSVKGKNADINDKKIKQDLDEGYRTVAHQLSKGWVCCSPIRHFTSGNKAGSCSRLLPQPPAATSSGSKSSTFQASSTRGSPSTSPSSKNKTHRKSTSNSSVPDQLIPEMSAPKVCEHAPCSTCWIVKVIPADTSNVLQVARFIKDQAGSGEDGWFCHRCHRHHLRMQVGTAKLCVQCSVQVDNGFSYTRRVLQSLQKWGRK